jgi:hypothetical protein
MFSFMAVQMLLAPVAGVAAGKVTPEGVRIDLDRPLRWEVYFIA